MNLPALSFTGSTDKVTCATGGGAPTAYSFAAWIYRNSNTDGRIFQRGLGGPAFIVQLSATAAKFAHGRATTTNSVETAYANVPGYGTGKWIFMAGALDSTLTDNDQWLYGGDLSTHCQPVTTYSVVRRVGTGTISDNTASALILGNKSNDSTPLTGLLGPHAIFNRQLQLVDFIRLQKLMRSNNLPDLQAFVKKRSCAGLWMPGRTSTGTQIDYSGYGNTGTITGAVPAMGPPMRGAKRRGVGSVIAAAGGLAHRVIRGNQRKQPANRLVVSGGA